MKKVCTSLTKLERGYTLIEILVVLTLIGLLFGIGFVSFRDFSRRQAVQGAARQLAADIRLAQGLAFSGKKPEECSSQVLDGYYFRVASPTSYMIQAVCISGGILTEIDFKAASLPAETTINTPVPNPIFFRTVAHGTNIVAGQTATLTITQTATGYTQSVVVGETGDVKLSGSETQAP